MHSTFYARYAKVILGLALLSMPAVGFGVYGSGKTIDNDVRRWLPDNFDETAQYDQFVHQFERDDVVVLSWPGCKLDDQRLPKIANELTNGASKSFFQRVITGPSLLEQTEQGPLKLSRRWAIRRLTGIVIGPDEKTTAAICVLSDEGGGDRFAAVDSIIQAAASAGVTADELRMGGPTIDQLALQQEARRSLFQFVSLSGIVAGLIAWVCLGHIRLTLMIFVVAFYSACLSLAIVYYVGAILNMIMIMMPTLVYVLGLSGSIHIVNYYKDEVRSDADVVHAPQFAIRRGWLPCTLASLTTALGLLSLTVSEVQPVRAFGLYSATGIIGGLIVLLLLLPSMLQLWPPQIADASANRRLLPSQRSVTSVGSYLVMKRYRWTIVVASLLMLQSAWSLQYLETTVKIHGRFSEQSRVIQDYRWLEQHLGPLVPMEIVLKFGPANDLDRLERVTLVRQIEAALLQVDEVGGTLSVATFAPPIPKGRGLKDAAQRGAIRRNLEKATDRLVKARVLLVDSDGTEHWRVSARVEALNEIDYGQFVQQLKDQIQPVLPASTSDQQRVGVVYTGVIPLVYKAQRELFNDLFESFFTAFGVIFVVILLIFRNVGAAVISMAPNLFPAVIIFGGMSWFGVKVELGSMVTASVALGIAVDDTLHYLTWFRRGIASGMTRVEAIRHAYNKCAMAMTQTTLICGLGLLMFMFSAYNPTRNFALMMTLLLVTALVGDLIFLPAILRSRLGRFMMTVTKEREST